MSLLVLDDIKKHFGAQEVLRGASLRIDPGQKVGIVGRNGGGKTTLLRMICQEESPDWGSVTLRKNARLGAVPQRPEFDPGMTVTTYVTSGLEEVHEAMARLESIGEAMGSAEGEALEKLLRDHDRWSARVDELGGWETERRVETVLSGIGLGHEFWEREANSLSGGEKSRVALARELVAGHDLLLLDEPTNHLDLEGIEWIERYIGELKTAVIVVSHDRRLLDNAVDSIVELERGKLNRFEGNYTHYIQQKEERFQAELKAWEMQQDELRREDLFIKKHMGSQRTAEAKGRAKRMSRVERLEKPHHDVRIPVIQPPKAARGGELVLKAEGLTAGYGDNILFEDSEVRIGRGQRVGIVGPNGAGKSTLLKILAGRNEPLAGNVELGHAAICSYYDQDTSGLRDDFTALGELRRDWPAMTDLEGRSHLAKFLFRGNDVEKMVGTLSGGERARLCLAKIVLTEPSWFAFDEPTNHLDLASRTALEEMLSVFDGALVCISHDRAFLDGLCDHVIEVSTRTVRSFQGNYSDWRRTKLEESEEASEARTRAAAAERKAAREREEKAARQAENKKKKGKQKGRGGAKNNGSTASSGSPAASGNRGGSGGKIKNPYMFEKLEKRIMQLEEKLEKAQAASATEEVFRDPDKLRDVQFEIAEIEHELTQANEEWENWETR